MASTKRESREPLEAPVLPRSEAWEAGEPEDEDEDEEEEDEDEEEEDDDACRGGTSSP